MIIFILNRHSAWTSSYWRIVLFMWLHTLSRLSLNNDPIIWLWISVWIGRRVRIFSFANHNSANLWRGLVTRRWFNQVLNGKRWMPWYIRQSSLFCLCGRNQEAIGIWLSWSKGVCFIICELNFILINFHHLLHECFRLNHWAIWNIWLLI